MNSKREKVMSDEELVALVDSQRKMLTAYGYVIDVAIDMLEALVLEEDTNPDKIEEIIKVLTDVS